LIKKVTNLPAAPSVKLQRSKAGRQENQGKRNFVFPPFLLKEKVEPSDVSGQADFDAETVSG
jgi:hypothetical protein